MKFSSLVTAIEKKNRQNDITVLVITARNFSVWKQRRWLVAIFGKGTNTSTSDLNATDPLGHMYPHRGGGGIHMFTTHTVTGYATGNSPIHAPGNLS